MTETEVVESKICGYDRCGRNFYRRPDQPSQSWGDQLYCSRGCGRRASYARVGRHNRSQQKRRTELPTSTRSIAAQVWRNHPGLACRGAPLRMFYAADGESFTDQQIAAARAMCGRCPVQDDCLEDGWDDRWGIQGGLTPEERRRLKQGGAA